MIYFCEECMVTKDVVQFKGKEESIICPECGKEMVEQDEKYHRMVNIIIEKIIGIKASFTPVVSAALREYADAIDDATDGDKAIRKYETKNGCKIKMIHGLECPVVNQ